MENAGKRDPLDACTSRPGDRMLNVEPPLCDPSRELVVRRAQRATLTFNSAGTRGGSQPGKQQRKKRERAHGTRHFGVMTIELVVFPSGKWRVVPSILPSADRAVALTRRPSIPIRPPPSEVAVTTVDAPSGCSAPY